MPTIGFSIKPLIFVFKQGSRKPPSFVYFVLVCFCTGLAKRGAPVPLQVGELFYDLSPASKLRRLVLEDYCASGKGSLG